MLSEAGRELTARIREMEMPTGTVTFERRRTAVTGRGLDALELLFSASSGQGLKPLSKVGSGGEVARVALALAVTRGARAGVVYMFDEVDQGLGGASAERVATLLRELGQKAQVLVVTHQAVAAARADRHLAVTKRVVAENSISRVTMLSGAERVSEIARMLSGSDDDTARRHAEALLEG